MAVLGTTAGERRPAGVPWERQEGQGARGATPGGLVGPGVPPACREAASVHLVPVRSVQPGLLPFGTAW